MLLVGGCEVVLGMQWLSTLGDVKWNFAELGMSKPSIISTRSSPHTRPIISFLRGVVVLQFGQLKS